MLIAGEPSRFLAILPVIALIGFLAGLANWWFTRYGVDGDALRIDSGIFERRSRRVRLDRLQAVDVVRPLAGRLPACPSCGWRWQGLEHRGAVGLPLRRRCARAPR